MTDDELRMVHELAAHEGLSAADVVRQYVRKAYASLPTTTTTTKKKGRK